MYLHKIEKRIINGIYVEFQYSTIKDLKLFQHFLYRHLKSYKEYDKKKPASN